MQFGGAPICKLKPLNHAVHQVMPAFTPSIMGQGLHVLKYKKPPPQSLLAFLSAFEERDEHSGAGWLTLWYSHTARQIIQCSVCRMHMLPSVIQDRLARNRMWVLLNAAEDSYAHTCHIPIHRHRGAGSDQAGVAAECY